MNRDRNGVQRETRKEYWNRERNWNSGRRIWALCGVLCVLLSACGKSAPAAEADRLIGAVGEVTLESGPSIEAAEAALAALEEKDAQQVEGGETLAAARAAYDALVIQAEAEPAENAIDAIGTVTAESADAIQAARTLYDSLSPEAREAVKNADALEAAEVEYRRIKDAEAASAAIDAIGTVTLESGAAVEQAEKAYNALDEAGRALVSNGAALAEARSALDALEAEEAAWVAAEREAREAAERAERLEAGRSVLSNMRKTEDKVEKITYYEHSREPVYADSRCFVLPYLEQRGDQVWLRIKYWYTDDDWLFWSSLTIVADEERFERSFSYFNVTRDNEDGMIWEYVDVRAGDRDIAMLDAIADSEETIVRFNGQQYYDDFTVPGADKKAIRDVLAAYEYLKAQSAQ
ncbi:MAG: hypothetical protein IJT94_15060 [Oscillibacter sp.]|nr:hypothetical protein [Oscillibacter sp.]